MHWKDIRVLLVDSDDSFAARTGRAFQKTNKLAELNRAHTLAEARAMLAATDHDVVLAAHSLPDGPATALIDSGTGRREVPIVALLEASEKNLTAGLIESGAVECYVKNGRSVTDLPRVAGRAVREWHLQNERAGVESDIRRLRDRVLKLRSMATSGLIDRNKANGLFGLLMPVLDRAGRALDSIPPRGAARRDIERVVRVAKLSKELVGEAVNANGSGGRRDADVGKVARDAVDLLMPAVPDGVEIRIAKAPGNLYVLGDSVPLFHAFMNLYTNAFDAMRSSGGVLHVDVDVAGEESGSASAGYCARVTVTDTGHGMEHEVLEHIFDPLFTTKTRAGNAGRGLADVREIVEDYGGTITVESDPGKGTVFQLLLPLSDRAHTGRSVARRPGRPPVNAPL